MKNTKDYEKCYLLVVNRFHNHFFFYYFSNDINTRIKLSYKNGENTTAVLIILSIIKTKLYSWIVIINILKFDETNFLHNVPYIGQHSLRENKRKQ